MKHWTGLVAAALFWVLWVSPALAQGMVMSGSRYSAPLWTWIAAMVVAVGLSIVGLLIGFWFLRKRSRIDASD